MRPVREYIAANGVVVHKFKCGPKCFGAVSNQGPNGLKRISATSGKADWCAGCGEAHGATPNAAAAAGAGVFGVQHVGKPLQWRSCAQLPQRAAGNVKYGNERCASCQRAEQRECPCAAAGLAKLN